jgi:hypothetical protein
MCFVVRKTTSKLECAILTTLFLPMKKTSTVGAPGRGNCSMLFPLNVLMVPSSMLTVASYGERLMCSGFCLGKTIRFGSLEFFADYFGVLSLSLLRGAF